MGVNMINKFKQLKFSKISLHIIFIIISLSFILPFFLVISASLTNEQVFLKEGVKLIPGQIDFSAYKLAFQNPKQIIDSYAVTSFQALVGTVMALFIMALCAYPLSRTTFPYKGIVTTILIIPMFFGGGLIPSYIINTKYLGLGNSVWVYILPVLVNVFQIVIIRTFFQGLPKSLVESAKIDGASEYTVLFRIILPLSKPVLATVGLINVLGRWNNWMTSLIYIKSENLYTLQYLLQRILREAEFLNKMAQDTVMQGAIGNILNLNAFPAETLKFAMCVIAAGPMLVVFPFFQKYFAKGLTIGAIKG